MAVEGTVEAVVGGGLVVGVVKGDTVLKLVVIVEGVTNVVANGDECEMREGEICEKMTKERER